MHDRKPRGRSILIKQFKYSPFNIKSINFHTFSDFESLEGEFHVTFGDLTNGPIDLSGKILTDVALRVNEIDNQLK